MSNENIERQIEFILEHQAKFSEDLDGLKEVQARQAANLDKLAETVSMMQIEMEANRVEMREAINNLIVANEVTRDFANKIAQLAIATSQRVNDLESKQ